MKISNIHTSANQTSIMKAAATAQRIIVTDPETHRNREFPVSETSADGTDTRVKFLVNGTPVEGKIDIQGFLEMADIRASATLQEAVFGEEAVY